MFRVHWICGADTPLQTFPLSDLTTTFLTPSIQLPLLLASLVADDLNTTLDTLDSSIDVSRDVQSQPSSPTPRPLLSLQRQCEVTIARQVDTHNVIAILEKAASFFSVFLMDYCCDFLGNNLDGVLERLAGEKRKAEFEFLVNFITGGGGGDDEEIEEPLR